MTELEHPPELSAPSTSKANSAHSSQPSLRAALLALGIGVVLAAMSHWRRRRPADVW